MCIFSIFVLWGPLGKTRNLWDAFKITIYNTEHTNNSILKTKTLYMGSQQITFDVFLDFI